MKKNEPLQFARTIWRVLSIGCFLFCATLLAAPVSAAPEVGGYWELDSVNRASFELVGSEYVSTWNVDMDVSCVNALLIVAASQYDVGENYAHWDSDTMTLATSTPLGASIHGYSIFFQQNPDLVSGQLQTLQTVACENNATAVLLCDVNSAIPILDYDMIAASNDTIYTPANSLLLSFLGNYVYFASASTDTYLGDNTVNGYRISAAYSQHAALDTGYELYYTPDSSGWLGWLVIDGESEPIATTTPPAGLVTGDITCCPDYTCAIPLTYTEDLINTEIAWGVDLPNCNLFSAEAANTMTLDIFADQPVYFPASSTMAVGEHTLCLAWSSADFFSIEIKSFSVLSATSTICAAMDIDVDIWCDRDVVCAGLATSTSIWSGLECSGKMLGCWAFTPLDGSLDFLSGQFSAIKTKAPFSLYFNLTDSLEDGFATTTDDRSGSIGVPMWSATSSSYYMITVANGSSTEKAIGRANAILFRNTQKWIIWAMVALIILIVLTKKK